MPPPPLRWLVAVAIGIVVLSCTNDGDFVDSGVIGSVFDRAGDQQENGYSFSVQSIRVWE